MMIAAAARTSRTPPTTTTDMPVARDRRLSHVQTCGPYDILRFTISCQVPLGCTMAQVMANQEETLADLPEHLKLPVLRSVVPPRQHSYCRVLAVDDGFPGERWGVRPGDIFCLEPPVGKPWSDNFSRVLRRLRIRPLTVYIVRKTREEKAVVVEEGEAEEVPVENNADKTAAAAAVVVVEEDTEEENDSRKESNQQTSESMSPAIADETDDGACLKPAAKNIPKGLTVKTVQQQPQLPAIVPLYRIQTSDTHDVFRLYTFHKGPIGCALEERPVCSDTYHYLPNNNNNNDVSILPENDSHPKNTNTNTLCRVRAIQHGSLADKWGLRVGDVLCLGPAFSPWPSVTIRPWIYNYAVVFGRMSTRHRQTQTRRPLLMYVVRPKQQIQTPTQIIVSSPSSLLLKNEQETTVTAAAGAVRMQKPLATRRSKRKQAPSVKASAAAAAAAVKDDSTTRRRKRKRAPSEKAAAAAVQDDATTRRSKRKQAPSEKATCAAAAAAAVVKDNSTTRRSKRKQAPSEKAA
jgi:hypothetical protein